MYDSTEDTQKHIARVVALLESVKLDISERQLKHDSSKLEPPEKEVFDKVTPKLKELSYGSIEYYEQLSDMQVALQHHYNSNRHHPEHFVSVDDMSLLDIIEMLVDWKAASERHNDGNIYKSIEINAERFNLSPQLKSILLHTALYLGW